MPKLIYPKEILTPNTLVGGNIEKFKQSYEILYYKSFKQYQGKVALYIYLNNEEKQYAKRSIYFSNIEQLKIFIMELTKAYFYFKDQTVTPQIPLSAFRNINLGSFLTDLREKIIKEWR